MACVCGDPECRLPPCMDCDEEHASSGLRCRDCDIQHGLDAMQCSACTRMRYRQDHPQLGAFGESLWGEACACDPRPPSVAQVKRRISPIARCAWLLMIADEYSFGDHVEDREAIRLRLDEAWFLFTYRLEKRCEDLSRESMFQGFKVALQRGPLR